MPPAPIITPDADGNGILELPPLSPPSDERQQELIDYLTRSLVDAEDGLLDCAVFVGRTVEGKLEYWATGTEHPEWMFAQILRAGFRRSGFAFRGERINND